MIDASEICFVGMGASAPCYYRALLPAHALGADYAGLVGEPPNSHYLTGLVKGASVRPDLTNYKAVVIQQPRGKGWLDSINALRQLGVTVLVEHDDYLHGIADQPDHDFRKHFGPDALAEYEECMRAADGLIVSTPYLKRAYRQFNKNIWVCENAIDPARYDYTRPKRDTVNILWAGATGHRDAVLPWLQQTAVAMSRRPHTCFVSIGQPFANGFHERFGERRAVAIPWCAIEQYPAAMTMGDVALAPAGRGAFFRGKSDLRWLEASALGIPVIGNHYVYRHIQHGRNGFVAVSPSEMLGPLEALLDDPILRRVVGDRARAEVLEKRSFPGAADQWMRAIEQAVKRRTKRAARAIPAARALVD